VVSVIRDHSFIYKDMPILDIYLPVIKPKKHL